MGVSALVACGSDGTNNSPFGVGTSASATATATATATAGSTGEGTGSSSGSDTEDASSTSGVGSTSVAPTTADPGSTSMGSTGVAEVTGDPTAGMQPADGLYSHCLSGAECDPIPALCITIQDMDDNPMDGFCSITPCVNPAVDCVPTPGGTALPACMPVTLDGMATNACALDCSGGMTCPTGMTCYTLEFGMICA